MTMDVPDIHALEEGIYPAKMVGLETKTTEAGTFRIWSFEIQTGGEPIKISATSSTMTGPKSKAYKWLSALIGRKPAPGEKGIVVAGRMCQLHLSVDEDTGYNKVEAVLPYGGGAASPQPATPAPAPLRPIQATVEDDGLPPLEEPPSKEELARLQ